MSVRSAAGTGASGDPGNGRAGASGDPGTGRGPGRAAAQSGAAGAVRQAFHVVWVLGELEREQPGPHNLGRIARRAGLAASHARKVLADAGARPFAYVTQAAPGKGYQLTATGRRLVGIAGGGHLPDPSPFRPLLAQLRERTGHSAVLHYLTTALGGALLCTLGDLAPAGGQHVEEQVLEFAFRPEPTRTAAGRVMLASLSPAVFERLPAVQKLDATCVLAIRNQRHETEAHRWPATDERWRTLAVPLLRDGHVVVGALSLTGPATHVPTVEETHLRQLRTTADHLIRAGGATRP